MAVPHVSLLFSVSTTFFAALYWSAYFLATSSAVTFVYIDSSSLLYSALPSISLESLSHSSYSFEALFGLTYKPRFLSESFPAVSLAVRLKSPFAPDVFELIKNLALFSSKLACTPASFNFTTNWLTVISSVSSILVLLPSTDSVTLPCDVLPVISDSFDEPVILAELSFVVTSPPVR